MQGPRQRVIKSLAGGSSGEKGAFEFPIFRLNFLSSVSRGVVQMGMSLADEITPVQSLFERYENVPASLADACLVRMSELYERCRVFTLDADFQVYRRHGRKVIPLLWPGLRPIP